MLMCGMSRRTLFNFALPTDAIEYFYFLNSCLRSKRTNS